jgi:hypothetical protein
MSSTKRALIVIAILLLCLIVAGGIFYYHQNRSLPPIVTGTGPSPAVVTQTTSVLNQLPPDAPAVAYIDADSLRTLQNSPLAAALALAWPGTQSDRDYGEFVRGTGFDYARDLDHAAVAMWPASFGTPANVLGDDRVLAIADGRFDQQKIQAYALRTGKQITRGGQTVFDVPGSPPVSLTFLSPTRIAIAGGKNATDLLDKINSSGSSSRDRVLESRIQRVAGAPIFAVARTDHLSPSFYANFSSAPQLEQLARSVQAVTLAGQPDGNNLRLTLDAESDSMKNALQISFLLETGKIAGSMALSDPSMRRQMNKEQIAFLQALINQAQITHQSKMVRIVLDLTPAMLNAAPPPRTISTRPQSSRPAAPVQVNRRQGHSP